MPNPSQKSKETIENNIPNWVLYVLLASLSLLIAKAVHGSIAIITALGIITLFALTYMSKPIAEIQPSNEGDIFNKNKNYKTYWVNPSEPHAQRRRYLKSINDIDKAA